MIDSIVDHFGEAASQLFLGVFAGLGKWLLPKRQSFVAHGGAIHSASL
jgi:hypothetical protein